MDDLFRGCERPEAPAAPCEFEQRPQVTVKAAKAYSGMYIYVEFKTLVGAIDSVEVYLLKECSSLSHNVLLTFVIRYEIGTHKKSEETSSCVLSLFDLLGHILLYWLLVLC